MKKKSFKKGGIHPPGHKDASTAIEWLELPRRAVVALNQHIGAPNKALVSRGEHVERGQLIGATEGFVSAGVHSPVTGTVRSVEALPGPNGMPVMSVVIEASEEEHMEDEAKRLEERRLTSEAPARCVQVQSSTQDEIRRAIRDAGIVGMGGATFPAHVKVQIKNGEEPELLIVNGCECEPYLTCDDALMQAWPSQVVGGAQLLARAAGAAAVAIGIEDNKPQAADAIRRAITSAASDVPVELHVLRTKYPQGGEKQLIEAITGRRVGSGALPLSVGCVVANVATCFAAWQAVVLNIPLTQRVVTLTGEGIPADERRNYMMAVGTTLGALPVPPADVKVIVGGPMMGRTAVSLEGSVTKGTSGLTVLPAPDCARPQPGPCIRCAACVQACPMGLEPYLLSRYGMLRRWDDARAAQVADCLECGACSYSCPAGRPLLDYIRLAKQRSRQVPSK